MIAYWGKEYEGQRHIVHSVKFKGVVLYTTVCGLWALDNIAIYQAHIDANCRRCMEATRP